MLAFQPVQALLLARPAQLRLHAFRQCQRISQVPFVRQFQFSSRIDYTDNHRHILESRRWHYFTVRTLFQSGDRIVVDRWE